MPKLTKIPFDLKINDDICSTCGDNIVYKIRIDSEGINYKNDCGSCMRCLRKKGCGGYEKYIDVEKKIPICNNCNTCLKCKKNIFNINETYDDKDFCKINKSYLHRECYKEHSKPDDDTKCYNWDTLTNKWEVIGIYITCDICKNKYVKKSDSAIITNICENCNFKNMWKKSTPEDKLNFYGIIKLKKLAKNKHIKGYSKYSKNELIDKLKPLVNGTDFPIQ